MKRILKVLLPIIVLATSVLAAKLLIDSRAEPETRIPEVLPPLVNVLLIELRDIELTVTSQGTVSPRTESMLVAEVSGQVTEVSPAFSPGGFFEAGDILLRIDPFDYQQARVQAKARVTQAELLLALEQAEAEVALEEWDQLGDEAASPLTLRIPQVADAQAAVAAAKAVVRRAERDLKRTEVRAPYAGRVRKKDVDVGQFVVRGNPVATIYAVDYAEIRLPLPDDELAFIDLPLDYRGVSSERPAPRVILRTRFAGRLHEWEGTIVRTEGEIDPQSRMVHVVAQVEGSARECQAQMKTLESLANDPDFPFKADPDLRWKRAKLIPILAYLGLWDLRVNVVPYAKLVIRRGDEVIIEDWTPFATNGLEVAAGYRLELSWPTPENPKQKVSRDLKGLRHGGVVMVGGNISEKDVSVTQ